MLGSLARGGILDLSIFFKWLAYVRSDIQVMGGLYLSSMRVSTRDAACLVHGDAGK